MDVNELPPFTFSFFDPEQNAYRTLTQPAMPLIVRPSAASLPPPVLAGASTASDNPPAKQDVVHIKPWLGTVARLQPPLVARPWFLALQGVPVLAWLCPRGSTPTAGPSRRQSAPSPPARHVERILRDGLADLAPPCRRQRAHGVFRQYFSICSRNASAKRLDLPDPPSPRPSSTNACFPSACRTRPSTTACAHCSTPATRLGTRPKLPSKNWRRSVPRSKPRSMN